MSSVRVGGHDRLLLRPSQAARAMNVSIDTFERYCRDHVKWVRLGRLRLVSVDELERFCERVGSRIVGDDWGEL